MILRGHTNCCCKIAQLDIFTATILHIIIYTLKNMLFFVCIMTKQIILTPNFSPMIAFWSSEKASDFTRKLLNCSKNYKNGVHYYVSSWIIKTAQMTNMHWLTYQFYLRSRICLISKSFYKTNSIHIILFFTHINKFS